MKNPFVLAITSAIITAGLIKAVPALAETPAVEQTYVSYVKTADLNLTSERGQQALLARGERQRTIDDGQLLIIAAAEELPDVHDDVAAAQEDFLAAQEDVLRVSFFRRFANGLVGLLLTESRRWQAHQHPGDGGDAQPRPRTGSHSEHRVQRPGWGRTSASPTVSSSRAAMISG